MTTLHKSGNKTIYLELQNGEGFVSVEELGRFFHRKEEDIQACLDDLHLYPEYSAKMLPIIAMGLGTVAEVPDFTPTFEGILRLPYGSLTYECHKVSKGERWMTPAQFNALFGISNAEELLVEIPNKIKGFYDMSVMFELGADIPSAKEFHKENARVIAEVLSKGYSIDAKMLDIDVEKKTLFLRSTIPSELTAFGYGEEYLHLRNLVFVKALQATPVEIVALRTHGTNKHAEYYLDEKELLLLDNTWDDILSFCANNPFLPIEKVDKYIMGSVS